MTDNVVAMFGVNFAYRKSKPLLTDMDLVVPQGKIIAIMGPSGTGKTTVLKLISGQLLPNSGEVTVFGKNISELRRRDLYRLRRNIGMLFQGGALFTDLSVYENVAYPLREHSNLTGMLLRAAVLVKLQMVGLRGAAQLMPQELSGGMVRRVALARAIALDPELIMYDEPFAGQDPITKGVLVQLIATLNQALGATTVIVSHDVPETMKLADYIYIIANGSLLGQGTPAEIMQHHDPAVQQFIAGLPDGPVPLHYPAAPLAQDFFGKG